MSNKPSKGDKLLLEEGFQLIRTEPSPLPEAPERKTYIYKREQSDEVIIIDALQGCIRLNDAWYSVSDLEALTAKAKELGL